MNRVGPAHREEGLCLGGTGRRKFYQLAKELPNLPIYQKLKNTMQFPSFLNPCVIDDGKVNFIETCGYSFCPKILFSSKNKDPLNFKK